MIETLVFAIPIGLYLLLMWKSGKIYPILYLFLLVYFVQYIFSTYIIYNYYNDLRSLMPISQSHYFGYLIPAFLSLFLGLFIFNKDIQIASHIQAIDPLDASRTGYLLVGISILFDLSSFLGLGVTSILSFTGYLKFLGAFCFLFSRSKWNYFFIVVIYTQLALEVIGSGVFISFFIWTLFLFTFIYLRFKLPFAIRTLLFILFIPIVGAIQGVKKEYREKIWTSTGKGSLGLLTDLAIKKGSQEADDPYSESSGVKRTIGRLSQGWHLGLTLKQVPAKVPIAEGHEMLNDIVASFLPRLLFEDKKSVNSKVKFGKYTGHKLRGNTSMSIGIVGDFYINFGRAGSYIMLFIFGAVIAKLLHYFITRYVLFDPINIIWVPYLLSYLIRANNDFYIFLNCLVKGFLVFLAVNYIRQALLRKGSSRKAAKPNPA